MSDSSEKPYRIETIEELCRNIFPLARPTSYATDDTGLIDSRTFTYKALESTKVSIYKDRFVFEQTVFQERVEWPCYTVISSTNLMKRPFGTTVKTIYYTLAGPEPIPMEVDTCTSFARDPGYYTNFIFALRDKAGVLYNLNLDASDQECDGCVWVFYKTNGDRTMHTINLTEEIGVYRDGTPRLRDIYEDRPDLQNFGLRFLCKEPVYYILGYLFSTFNFSLNDVFSSFLGGHDYESVYKLVVEKIYPYISIFRMKQIKEDLIAAAMHPRRIESLLEKYGFDALECF